MMQVGIQPGDPVPLLDGHWSADGLSFAVSDKVGCLAIFATDASTAHGNPSNNTTHDVNAVAAGTELINVDDGTTTISNATAALGQVRDIFSFPTHGYALIPSPLIPSPPLL
jgi:hypothetical protein